MPKNMLYRYVSNQQLILPAIWMEVWLMKTINIRPWVVSIIVFLFVVIAVSVYSGLVLNNLERWASDIVKSYQQQSLWRESPSI